MDVAKQVIFALICAIAGSTLAVTWMLARGYRKGATKIVVAAKKVDNRVVPNYTRAQRRAWKRRRRG